MRSALCACGDSASDGNDPEAVVERSSREAEAAVDRARIASNDALSDEPSYRRLARGEDESSEPDVDPMEVVDASAESPEVDADELDSLAEEYGVELSSDEEVTGFVGNFSKESEGEEFALVTGASKIEFHGAGGPIAQLELEGDIAPDGFEQLGVAPEESAPQAVRLVRDDTLQILVHWREEDDDGFVYKVGVFKVIGDFVGQIFERPLGNQPDEEASVRQKGAYEVLHGDDHRFVRWIPAGDDGELLTDDADVLEWNQWEGVYRVPETPPTAPDDEKLRSRSLLGPEMPVGLSNHRAIR